MASRATALKILMFAVGRYDDVREGGSVKLMDDVELAVEFLSMKIIRSSPLLLSCSAKVFK